VLVLALDTSASTLSVALLDDEKILSENLISESGRQAELLIPQLEKILNQHKIWYQDLGLIAATNGPGSFTGSRIGLTAARTLHLATNLPLVLVNSCEVIAYKYRETTEEKIFVALDAAANEFFCAEFFVKNQKLITSLKPQLTSLEAITNFFPQEKFFLCGSGKKIIADFVKEKNFTLTEEKDEITAGLVGLLAYEKFCKDEKSSEDLNPLYLRAPRITERKR
jgi:tRNA threonylcarbamoyladenosine biosynthesis protein TsaB